MEVGAIVIVGNEALGEDAFGTDSYSGSFSSSELEENCAGTPIAALDVMGHSVLQRSLSSLCHQGIGPVSVIAADTLSNLVPTLPTRSVEISLVHEPASPWLAAQRSLLEYANAGMKSALLMRVGAYVEFDLGSLLQFHHVRRQCVTPVYDVSGKLNFWAVDLVRYLEEGAEFDGTAALESQLSVAPYFLDGYTNRLRNGADFRRLIVDGLLSRCSIKPDGIETKPGIWIGEGARVHRRSRVVAPAYIGAKAKIQEGTLITRCSSIGRGCRVEYGSVIEDSSILPDTYVGACLDVSHALVCGNKLLDLRRNVAVKINDPALVDGPGVSTTPSFAAERNTLSFPLSMVWARKFRHKRHPELVPSESNL